MSLHAYSWLNCFLPWLQFCTTRLQQAETASGSICCTVSQWWLRSRHTQGKSSNLQGTIAFTSFSFEYICIHCCLPLDRFCIKNTIHNFGLISYRWWPIPRKSLPCVTRLSSKANVDSLFTNVGALTQPRDLIKNELQGGEKEREKRLWFSRGYAKSTDDLHTWCQITNYYARPSPGIFAWGNPPVQSKADIIRHIDAPAWSRFPSKTCVDWSDFSGTISVVSGIYDALSSIYTCRSPAVSFVVSDVQWFWLKTRHFNRNVRLNGVGGQQDSCWCSRQPPCSLHWSTFQERKNCECHWYRETVDGNRAWDAHITVSQKWFRHSASKLTNRGLV